MTIDALEAASTEFPVPGAPVAPQSLHDVLERSELIRRASGLSQQSTAAVLIAYVLDPFAVQWLSAGAWDDYLVGRPPAEFDALVSIVQGLLETGTPQDAADALTNHVRARHGLPLLQ